MSVNHTVMKTNKLSICCFTVQLFPISGERGKLTTCMTKIERRKLSEIVADKAKTMMFPYTEPTEWQTKAKTMMSTKDYMLTKSGDPKQTSSRVSDQSKDNGVLFTIPKCSRPKQRQWCSLHRTNRVADQSKDNDVLYTEPTEWQTKAKTMVFSSPYQSVADQSKDNGVLYTEPTEWQTKAKTMVFSTLNQQSGRPKQRQWCSLH